MAHSPSDREAALMACAKGDQKAFQDLYHHEAPHMLALCLKLLPQRAAAEGLLQETFVLIWKNADSFDPALSSARAWMYSILRYRALGRLRQPGRSRQLDEPWNDTLPQNAPAAGDQPAVAPALAILQQLSEPERRAILMAYYGGYSYEQIAVRLKRSAIQVKTAVQQGLQRISRHTPA